MTYHSSAARAPEKITADSSVSASPAPLCPKKAPRQQALLPAKAATRHAYAHLLGHASLPPKRRQTRAHLECFTRASSERAIRRPAASDLATGVARLIGCHVEGAFPAERPYSHGRWTPC